MTQQAWLSANPEREFGARAHSFGLSPRLPPLSEIGRLSSSPSYSTPRTLGREKRMLDYSSALGGQQQQGLYGQQDVSGDNASLDPRHAYGTQDAFAPNSHLHPSSSSQYGYHAYGHHSTPDLQRVRDNSSSSLNSQYGISSGAIYPHPQFASSQSSFSSTGSAPMYDVGNINSFATAKGPYPTNGESSLGYPGADHSSSFFSDTGLDRRGSNMSLGSSYDPSMQTTDYPIYSTPGMQLPPHIYSHEQPGSIDGIESIMPRVTNMLPDSVAMYDGLSLSSTPDPSPDMTMPSMDALLSDASFQQGVSSGDVELFMRPILEQYIRAPNRLAFGEKTIIVMSSKVAQKSYGTEKRFLCPPPTALLVGNSWWSDSFREGDDDKLRPPRVIVSISGENPPPEATIDWNNSNGKTFSLHDPPLGTTYIGRCVGKQLYISDADEKRKKVEALVQVMAPASDDGVDRVIGVFPSRPIKVISKPSKKRQSAKNLELCINHGTTVSLFHRLRSQTVSTRYLCVSGSTSAIKGSDGAPLLGLDARIRQATPSFIAKTSAWDAFVLYIVDVNHKPSPSDAPLPPPAADFPAPPPNAIPFTNNGSPIPVYYNQTVVLQCMTSGVVSPVLVIRKVDHTTTAVGGGTPDHTKAAADHFCPPGEVCGDPVSQLHKIAFEVFDVNATPPMDGSPGDGGAFLSCMGEKVNTFRPVESRKWTSRAGDSPVLPSVSTPLGSSASFGSVGDYFSNGGMNSLPPSPRLDFQSHDGGRVRKKRSASSTGGIRSRGARRRPPSNDSMSPTGSHFPEMAMNPFHGAQWQVEIGETSVWTIVGVDQVRYNFYIPPVLLDNPNAPRGQSFPIPKRQITPFMGVVKWLPADRAAEVVRQGHHWQPAQPQRDQSKLLTLYGENFNRADPPRVFFGADPSPLVEVRCDQVVGCLPPDPEGHVPQGPRRPIILVRADGVVYPTMTMYP